MDKYRTVTAQFGSHLPDGFQKRQRLDITDGATDFNQGDIGITRAFINAALDFISNMRNDLYGIT